MTNNYYSEPLEREFPDRETALEAELERAQQEVEFERSKRLEAVAQRDRLRADIAKLVIW